MAKRFTKEECIVALGYLAAYKDDYTDREKYILKERLMPFYGLGKKIDTNNFLDKWNTLIKGGRSDVEQAIILESSESLKCKKG